MANQRRAGLIQFKVDGEVYDAVGDFTYNPGGVKREELVGADGIHGYKETAGVPWIQGAIRDRSNLKTLDLMKITDATITLELGNGKLFYLRNAFWAGDGDMSSEEATMAVRFVGLSGREITA